MSEDEPAWHVQVRAKFTVTEVTLRQSGSGKLLAELRLQRVYDSRVPEEHLFAKYAPSDEIRMTVTNPAVISAMKPGVSFYADFTPVSAESAT